MSAGTIFEKTGIADVTADNVDQIMVLRTVMAFGNYDTDGILEKFWCASQLVLGIAFPEWADEETVRLLPGQL